MRSAHSDRLERWLGAEHCAQLSAQMRGWYGTPIAVAEVPGAIYVNGQGDFEGKLEGGQFGSLADYYDDCERRARRRMLARMARRTRQLGGFGTYDEARSFTQHQRLNINKNTAQVLNVPCSAWRQGTNPVAGAAAAAAAGGTVPTSASTGAIPFTNPASGTTHFLGAEMTAANAATTVLLYDRIFAVAKTMNSTADETVTGVPTRYQSTTQGAVDSAENNFLFIEVGTVLPATAHNWGPTPGLGVIYTDQGGTGSVVLPTVTGISAAAAGRLDHANWWCPLASGDTGIKELDSMSCTALVATGAVDFVIGHPIAWIPCNPRATLNEITRDERINSSLNLARIFNDACLAFLGFAGGSNGQVLGQIHIGAR